MAKPQKSMGRVFHSQCTCKQKTTVSQECDGTFQAIQKTSNMIYIYIYIYI